VAAKKEAVDYGALRRALQAEGPKRVYLLYGAEDYLQNQFAADIRAACLSGGGEDWNYHRLDGPNVDLGALEEAVSAVPFFGARTLAELWGFDLNACKAADAERLRAVIEDIPDYCTLLITLPAGYEPDGRLAVFKAIKKAGGALEFTAQGQNQLMTWIARRFAALHKSVSRAACEQLIFMTGGLMGRILPEIEKLAAYVKSEEVSLEDVKAVAIKFPEANVFEMGELIAGKDYAKAAAVLQELLDMRTEPIMILAMLGRSMRQLYTARLLLDRGQGIQELMAELDIRFEFIARRLLSGARGFDAETLRAALRRMAEADLEMKSGRSAEGAALLTELLLSFAVEHVR